MKIFITGGTGFIGRVLLANLLKRNDIESIECIDNLSNSKYEIGEPAFSDPRVTMEVVSVDDYKWSGTKFDIIYHLASPVGPVGVLKYPGTMGMMIVGDTYKMATVALTCGAKLIDISTSEVYGTDPKGVPQVEELNKFVSSNITVRQEYAVAKLLCEIFLTNLSKIADLKFNIIRPYNIVSYGQQAAAGFVLPRFLEQALAGDPITVYLPGTQKRTFTDVRDFVDALVLVAERGINGEIYNIGNPANRLGIREFAEQIKLLTNSLSEIIICDPKQIHGKWFEEANEKIPDITKITRDTGWKPFRTIEDIISFAVERACEV